MCIKTTRTLIAFLRRAKENEGKLDFFYKVTAHMHCINSIGGVLELATAVPILLTLPISVSPYEHPFSKIKLIRLISGLQCHQTRLANLTDLSIENEVASPSILTVLSKTLQTFCEEEYSFEFLASLCHLIKGS
jgi:hypothetical protein